MRASRLLSILILLQTRGRMTAEALAAEFEVSVRTVYRDVDQLSAAGVPVYAERGRAGGFALLDGYRTRLTGLNAGEAEALAFAGLPGPARELGLGEALAQAQLKLLAALPPEHGRSAGKVAARFHFDSVGWYDRADSPDWLPAIADALWRERKLQITYEGWKGVVERTVEPLGLVLKAGVWYLVAAVKGAPRTYRVSNIQTLAVTSEGFEFPQGFELAAWWAAASAEFLTRLVTGHARVRVSPAGLERLSRIDPQTFEHAQAARGPEDADGWCEVTVPIESVEHAAGQLLRLGAEAEALDPPELRARMAEITCRMAGLYG
jgi:predicted DNA-binding transcriptional regulator YafY